MTGAAPSLSILVAEDNAISREILMHQLRILGREAVAVTDGREALRVWRAGDFALLLTDLKMPGLSGCELAGLIRSGARRADAPIVLLTAGSDSGDATPPGAAIDEVLTKPVSMVALRAVLERWLGPTLPAEPDLARPEAP